MSITDRRFIEESFPVKEVGEASAKEKNIRHGHISTLHIWWARRPLAASRATAYAALTPAPKDAEEWQKKRDFIIQLCQWENSNNQPLLERARREILEANGGMPPKVLDPFTGGGSYPLEALRLGCESYANDYNPVAVLIEKATLEYPQKFGHVFDGLPDWAKSKKFDNDKTGISGKQKKKGKEKQALLFDEPTDSQLIESLSNNPLINSVRYWGEWVLEETRKELAEFYPHDSSGNIPIAYIWARTIPCQNPSCGLEIPLMRQFWLANKDKKKVALYPDVSSGKIVFKIVGDGYAPWPAGFDAEAGTVARAVATCPVCGNVIDDKTTRKLFLAGISSEQMIAVVMNKSVGLGKLYRVAELHDNQIFEKAKLSLEKKRVVLLNEWGMDPVPNESLPLMSGVFNAPLYGIDTWGKLYNSRQQLALITIVNNIRKLYSEILISQVNAEFAKAIVTYLGLCVSRTSDFTSNMARWKPDAEALVQALTRQAIPMIWDFTENNPIGDSAGTWFSMLNRMLDVLPNLSNIEQSCQVSQGSATNLEFADNYFDAIFTDPPYYNNVTYADISDFFYVWLSRCLGTVYPDLFITPLSPKEKEITEMAGWDPVRYAYKDKAFFEDNLKKAFIEIKRILRPNGIAVIVYAHKSTSGWETVINALLDCGLILTGAWPINTEMAGRLRSQDSAALGSSIYIVARKMPRHPTGFYNDVRTELRLHMDTKLHRLWEEGIGGGDFFIAAIGSAIEIFGKYEKVMDYEGNIVRANRLLEEVRVIATNYAVKQILHDEFATEVSPMARFYVLWRWNYGEALVPFDEANKLAHSCGMDLSLQFGKKGFIKKEKENARLLGPQNRKLDDLDDPRDMIDVLHKSLLLWEKGQRSELVKVLAESGQGRSAAFYRVAQAISETLPLESKEKKLLDGFLAGRDRIQDEVEKSGVQGTFFE